jgi:hypothetical protein
MGTKTGAGPERFHKLNLRQGVLPFPARCDALNLLSC